MKTKLTLLFIAFICILSFSTCRKENDQAKVPIPAKTKLNTHVIGGSATVIEDKPYQVAIFVNGQFNGGGVILSENWIITAAHVVTNGAITVRYGSTTLSTANSKSIDQVIIHPNYGTAVSNGINLNDVALLHLQSPLSFDAKTSPIRYANSTDAVYVNLLAKVSGWGYTDFRGGTLPDNLYATNVTINNLNNHPSLIYCVSQTTMPQGACGGDSGGPLTASDSYGNDQLVGIVNAGSNNCLSPPDVYARVSYFATWIKEKTGVTAVYKNTGHFVNAFKNDCTILLNRDNTDYVEYYVPYGKYVSTISQADANAKADVAVETDKQAFANAYGSCGIIRKPIGIYANDNSGSFGNYKEDIYWANNIIAGSAVKIEVFLKETSNDVPYNTIKFAKLISSNAPNTGSFANGIIASDLGYGIFLIKITSLTTGNSFYSGAFRLGEYTDD